MADETHYIALWRSNYLEANATSKKTNLCDTGTGPLDQLIGVSHIFNTGDEVTCFYCQRMMAERVVKAL